MIVVKDDFSFGQKRDEHNGMIQCWFTHDALNEIKKLNLKNKIIWAWGAGLGDSWLAMQCKKLYVVERDEQWLMKASAECGRFGVNNVEYFHRPCEEGSGAEEMYCEIPKDVRPDVFIVDDVYRYECILKAIEMKPNITIIDNYNQDYVFICPSAEDALDGFRCQIFPQKDHTNFEKRRWKTAIFYIE